MTGSFSSPRLNPWRGTLRGARSRRIIRTCRSTRYAICCRCHRPLSPPARGRAQRHPGHDGSGRPPRVRSGTQTLRIYRGCAAFTISSPFWTGTHKALSWRTRPPLEESFRTGVWSTLPAREQDDDSFQGNAERIFRTAASGNICLVTLGR